MKIVEEFSTVKEKENLEMKYFYRIIESIYNDFPVYGIEIERKDYKGLSIVNEVKDSIKLISRQRHKVKQIIMKLVKNEASPIHLIDILGEYVDEQAYKFELGLVMEA